MQAIADAEHDGNLSAAIRAQLAENVALRAEVARLRAAAAAVTLTAGPRSSNGSTRTVDATALFALDELAIDHRVPTRYVSVERPEVERLRAIEQRAIELRDAGTENGVAREYRHAARFILGLYGPDEED